MYLRSDVFSGMEGSGRTLFVKVLRLSCAVAVLSVRVQEHFGGDVGDRLGNLLLYKCVSLS